VKPHPYADGGVFMERLPDDGRVRFLSDTEDVDVNCLLRVADALITDYSSAAFDYALLDRPIHLFAPDIDEYRAHRRLQMPFQQLIEGRHHREWAPLLDAVRQSATGDGQAARELARSIRQLSMNDDRPGSSERIVSAVLRAVGRG
jgi:CDP-glycerol glycerophosphotransferase